MEKLVFRDLFWILSSDDTVQHQPPTVSFANNVGRFLPREALRLSTSTKLTYLVNDDNKFC